MRQFLLEIWETTVAAAEQLPQEVFWVAGGCFSVIFLWMILIRLSRRRKQTLASVTGVTTGGGKDSRLDQVETVTTPAPGIRIDAVASFQPVMETFGEPAPEPEIGPPPDAAVFEPVGEAKTIETAGFLGRLKSGLSKTRNTISGGLDRIFSGSRKLDGAALEDIEELLITADIGVQATMSLIQKVSARASEISNIGELKSVLKEEILTTIDASQRDVAQKANPLPKIIMVVGVNGVGKTTTIGKLAARMAGEGKRVLIVAADTFRAAAIEQLTIWAERAGAEIVKHRQNADPAAVAYDGVEAAVARGMDVVLVDTAGRLHTKVNLMEELKKIKRTIAKKIPDAPHEVLMVLDATTGQNALVQAKMFHEALNVTGIVLTKLDGTAKGGIVIAICSATNIPLHYIGVGEQTEDLQNFNSQQFVDALF